MTEREVVLRERAAAARAIDWFTTRARCDYGINCGIDALDARRYVEENHPLPTVTRPRVVSEEWGMMTIRYRVIDGKLQDCWKGEWKEIGQWLITPERVKIWADLLANPTETVPEDA